MKNKVRVTIFCLLSYANIVLIGQECPNLSYLHQIIEAKKSLYDASLYLKSSVNTLSISVKKESVNQLIEYNAANPNQLITSVYQFDNNTLIGIVIPPTIIKQIQTLNDETLQDGRNYLGFIGAFPVQTLIKKTDTQNICSELKKEIMDLEKKYLHEIQQEVMVKKKQSSSVQPKNTDKNISSRKNNTFLILSSGIFIGVCSCLAFYYFYLKNAAPFKIS